MRYLRLTIVVVALAAAVLSAAVGAFAQASGPATTGVATATPATTAPAVATTAATPATRSAIGHADALASSRPATTAGPAAVVTLEGVVDDFSRDSLFKRFREAKAAGAKTIILKLDTPGGLVSAAMDITRFLRSQDDVRTVAYVDGMALSAGIMIGLACDELVMAPDSKIGDSAPIMMTSNRDLATLGETERAKVESPILSDFYASSVRNGYDPLLTAAMVTMKRVVYYVQAPGGERKFVEEREYDRLIKDGWKMVPGVPAPVDADDTLLTVHSDLAERLGLSRGTYATPEAFASSRGIAVAATYAPHGGERVVGWLGSEVVRGVLISVLLMAMYAAFSHPGQGWPEAIVLICLAVVVGVPMLTGYATWWEAIAILAGLIFLAIELFVIPGFGVTGIVGLVLLLGGLIMTFVAAEPAIPGTLPQLKGTWISLQRGLMVVTAALAVSLLLWMWLSRYLPRLPYFNRLILTSVAGDVEAVDLLRPVETGPAVGDVGVTVSELKPGGAVKFITDSYPEGRIAAVVSESGYVAAGSNVVVREVAGNRVVVRTQQA
ncbi:MAG TPA: hypothetical protein VER17_17545 [Tepidisphaeraceae bacterium]|nr:hypothetical protein [Tepidisphaeraceae bacterium]